MQHIRTISGVINYLHQQDSECAVTAHYLRLLIKNGTLPYRRAGTKYLLAVEDVIAYFEQCDECNVMPSKERTEAE